MPVKKISTLENIWRIFSPLDKIFFSELHAENMAAEVKYTRVARIFGAAQCIGGRLKPSVAFI